MMFLFAVPMGQAVAIYLVPLMIGARNIAFPRMVAYAYWLYLFGGVMLFVALILDIGPDAGWFSLHAACGTAIRHRQAQRFLGAAHHLHRGLRPDGRSRPDHYDPQVPRAGHVARRMPLFVWAMLGTNFMIDLRHAGGHGQQHRR